MCEGIRLLPVWADWCSYIHALIRIPLVVQVPKTHVRFICYKIWTGQLEKFCPSPVIHDLIRARLKRMLLSRFIFSHFSVPLCHIFFILLRYFRYVRPIKNLYLPSWILLFPRWNALACLTYMDSRSVYVLVMQNVIRVWCQDVLRYVL